MIEYSIQAEGLTKTYKHLTAVHNLNLQITKGELFGLVGPDGAGKTTTIQMLCGILSPSAGQAKVLGYDTVKETESIRGKIGYMSEGFSLYGSLTVAENIEFFADLYKVPAAQRAKRKQKLLHFSRLTRFQDRAAEKLSGGMKKKLALCCTLIYSPEILFLDEPTLGVDPVSRREFWKILHDFRQEGITIFVTTPYMDEAERCDKVALLDKGKMIGCDAPSVLRRSLKGELIELKCSPQRKAFDLLKRIPGVFEVQVFGNQLHAQVENFQESTEWISKVFAGSGIQIDSLRRGIPGLEDVFVSAIPKEGSQQKLSQLTLTAPAPVRHFDETKIVVSLDHLTKTFGNFTAVNHLSLEVRQGEIFGFLGPNGSGKSTTIRMLTGLIAPTFGTATVGGLNIAKEPARLKPQIGYMSQKFSLYNDLTVEENINLYAGIYGVNKERFTARKNWVLEMAGLSGKEKAMTKGLSGGWKQRLALGCAILHEPSILFLDEPTSGVDPIARRLFWELIYELASQGVTIFVTTHYMDEAEHCHNLAFIYNGNLIALGSPSSLKREKVPSELLEIECNHPFEAIELLQQANYQASSFGSKIHILVTQAQQEVNHIDQLLSENGFKIERIEQVPLTLEDLFVHLIEEDDKRRNQGVS